MFDLGVSSYQLTGNKRGFSFLKSEVLDMRMDPETQKVTAYDLIHGLSEKELAKLITIYGEDPLAYAIARRIVFTRKKQSIRTTRDLADILFNIYQKSYRTKSQIHPATKTFQALRIAVNDEINNIKLGLNQSLECLKPGGRIVVISFHGLEDRTIKNIFINWQTQSKGEITTKKPIIPTNQERLINPRCRSAKLRIFKKYDNIKSP